MIQLYYYNDFRFFIADCDTILITARDYNQKKLIMIYIQIVFCFYTFTFTYYYY